MLFLSLILSGTDLECQYKLMTFGIPNRILPISPNGDVDMSMFLDWLDRRKNKEKQQGMPVVVIQTVEIPGPYDVLLGRGKLIQEHSGNLRYRHIVENHKERYEKASKAEKTSIAKEIIQIVKDNGGRFFKKTDEGWTEASTEIARDKVSHSFRNRRIAVNGQKKEARVTSEIVKPSSSLPRNDYEVDKKRPRLEQSFSPEP
jgi:hypothetical protein